MFAKEQLLGIYGGYNICALLLLPLLLRFCPPCEIALAAAIAQSRHRAPSQSHQTSGPPGAVFTLVMVLAHCCRHHMVLVVSDNHWQ